MIIMLHLANTCNSLTYSPFAIGRHSEKYHNNLGKNSPGLLCHRISSKTEGMRIIQAAAVSYYFEDGLSGLGRKPVAMPIMPK